MYVGGYEQEVCLIRFLKIKSYQVIKAIEELCPSRPSQRSWQHHIPLWFKLLPPTGLDRPSGQPASKIHRKSYRRAHSKVILFFRHSTGHKRPFNRAGEGRYIIWCSVVVAAEDKDQLIISLVTAAGEQSAFSPTLRPLFPLSSLSLPSSPQIWRRRREK